MKVQFTETVLRDANQSLIATRLPFKEFEGILETMDRGSAFARSAKSAPTQSSKCCCAGKTCSATSIIPTT